MTEETQAGTVAAESEIAPSIDRTVNAPPVKPGFQRSYFDTPIDQPPPKPLIEQVWSYIDTEATRFDRYANQLYAAMAPLIEENRRASGLFGPLEGERLMEPEIVHRTQIEIDALGCAISKLQHAASELRGVRLALAPHVDPEIVKRGY